MRMDILLLLADLFRPLNKSQYALFLIVSFMWFSRSQ